MIVRILDDGQFELDVQPSRLLGRPRQAARGGPRGQRRAGFHHVLGQLVEEGPRRGQARSHPIVSSLPTSPLPPETASLDEVRDLLASEDTGES